MIHKADLKFEGRFLVVSFLFEEAKNISRSGAAFAARLILLRRMEHGLHRLYGLERICNIESCCGRRLGFLYFQFLQLILILVCLLRKVYKHCRPCDYKNWIFHIGWFCFNYLLNKQIIPILTIQIFWLKKLVMCSRCCCWPLF